MCDDIPSSAYAFISEENAVNVSTINIFPHIFHTRTGLKETEFVLKLPAKFQVRDEVSDYN